MKIKLSHYLMASSCVLLSQGVLICNASSIQSSFEEQRQEGTLSIGVGKMSIQQRDSDTSEDSTMKDDRHNLQPSIANVIFKRACEIIPNLADPEVIKPNVKDRFSFEYSKKFDEYDHLKTLNKYFLEAIDGDNESKELLALWLLKGIKDISKDFYERYGANPSESKSLLKMQIEQLLNEYRDYPDPELDIDADVLLERLNDYAAKW